MEERLAGQWCWGRTRGRGGEGGDPPSKVGGGSGGRMPILHQGPKTHLHHRLHFHRWLQNKGNKDAVAAPPPFPPQLRRQLKQSALIDFLNHIHSRGRGSVSWEPLEQRPRS